MFVEKVYKYRDLQTRKNMKQKKFVTILVLRSVFKSVYKPFRADSFFYFNDSQYAMSVLSRT